MERIVRPGEFYRHFKNNLYQIVAIASHSETGERMVVYQALYGDFGVYVRPYEMFISPVDREKYPHADQEYRFERVERTAQGFIRLGAGSESGAVAYGQERMQDNVESRETFLPNPAFLRFLESETYEERMEWLKKLSGSVSQRELDSIYLVLDMKPETGSIEEQLRAIGRCLTMQNRFDGNRLR